VTDLMNEAVAAVRSSLGAHVVAVHGTRPTASPSCRAAPPGFRTGGCRRRRCPSGRARTCAWRPRSGCRP
jgi:hypothetical protein